MSDVRFAHVTKRYGENAPVIKDLNLEVKDHEFLVLVGPSGCGKSTALRMIAGLEDITEGELFIGDRLVNNVPPKDRDIAMVFQNYALYPHMSVYDNMAFSLKLRHTSKEEIDKRVHQAAQMLGIEPYLQRKPKELSGGQRQRVALGRALVREPKVFLLDEPLSNLDAKLRVQTRTEIAKLHQTTGTTFVYVTHDQVEAMTMGDRIALLNAGIIQQLGTPQELYDNPANLFAAGFIGSPSMDFFKGVLKKTGSDAAEVVIGEGAEINTLPLSGRSAQEAAGQATPDGRQVIVGVRPEDLSLASDGSSRPTLHAIVDIVEHLGNEQLIYVQAPGAVISDTTETKAITARVAADAQIQPGERVTLAVDPSKLHIFDPQTTQRLGLPKSA